MYELRMNSLSRKLKKKIIKKLYWKNYKYIFSPKKEFFQNYFYNLLNWETNNISLKMAGWIAVWKFVYNFKLSGNSICIK